LKTTTEAYAGHLGKAREVTRRAVESALRADNKESAGLWQVASAWRESMVGNLEEARHAANSAVAIAPDTRDVQQWSALTLARAGDAAASGALVQKLTRQYPMNTIVQSYWLPIIQAQLALSQKHPQAAVDQTQKTTNLDFALPLSTADNSCLYPVYLRGEAYLALGQGGAAAVEFQKIIDHRGLVWNCITGALVRLELGRAQAMAGDKAKARAAYQDFLTLWKDADPDIPVLKEAKAEFAKLQ
jgi:eukaryotic-like serine/threonine-protein kinase